MGICSECTRPVIKQDKNAKIQCVDCKNWYHNKCVQIKETDVDFKKTHWRCNSCLKQQRDSIHKDDDMLETLTTMPSINDLYQLVLSIKEELTKLKKSGDNSEKQLGRSLDLAHEKLDENSKTLKEQSEKLTASLAKIEFLQEENLKLKKQLSDTQLELDELNQYGRRNTVEIYGVPESANEDTYEVVKKIGQVLDMDICTSMIDACHRLKKPPHQSSGGIVVKFVRRADKDFFVQRRKHPLRHRHSRLKRQHAHAASQTYLPGSFVVDGASGSSESGDWGPWSEPSDCSRSCGGGVAFQTRRCRDISARGEDLCRGGSKRYFSCNIQDCPEVSSDFRAEQCAEFNAIPFEGRFYKWVPYTKAPNKCELNCMPKGERFYFRHRRKVIDGTRCDEEKLDICVDGQCLPVGCDMMLGSTAREDKCRECGGDGSSCNTNSGLLEMDDLQVGYNDILLIPAGATNIQVREIQASNNYLAIRNVTGHYYLNGNWRIDFPRSLKFAGTIFHYERKPHGFYAPESVAALGPTTEPIYIVLLYQETNPGVQYEYSIPKGVSQQTDPDSYSWTAEEFSECSATCGGGYQIRNVTCARRRDLEVVPDYLCDPSLEPARNQSCGTDPCPPHWALGEWGPCSETCGEGGIQIRQIYCEQIVSGGLPSVVDEVECTDILGPKPPTTQKCNEDVKCPTWHVGPWKPCNRLCGEGVQKRRVRCFRRTEGKIEVLGDSACSGEKPEEEKPCELRPCEGVDWVVSDWSGCEDKCGLTQETRKIHCANQMGKLYPDNYCHLYRIPELTQECESSLPCEHEWFASQWSECSARCGNGIQTRKVFCGDFDGETVKKVNDEKCDIRKKYDNEKNCTGQEECAGQWYAGPWTACSKPCGGGVMSRKVLCFIENNTVDPKNCDPSTIHFSSETCNNHPCTKDHILPMEPAHEVGEDEEECEEETDGTVITMETTLGLDGTGVTPVSGATELEGSGEMDTSSAEFESSEVTSEATLLTSGSDSSLSPEFSSSIRSSEVFSTSSSVGEISSLLPSLSTGSSIGIASEDIMLSDSTGLSSEGESTDFTAMSSSDSVASSDAAASSSGVSSTDSSTEPSISFSNVISSSTSSSSLDEDTATSSSDISSSTDIESISLTSSSYTPSSESSSSSVTVSDTSSSDLSSVSSSDLTSESDLTDSTPESSSVSSISTSSDITSETGSGEGSGMTTSSEMDTDITGILTGSGMGTTSMDDDDEPFISEVEEPDHEYDGSGEISEHSTIKPDISSTDILSTTDISSVIDIASSTESSSTEISSTEISTTESSVLTTESSLGSSFGSSTETTESSVLTTESSVLTTASSLGSTTETSEETASTLLTSEETSTTEYTSPSEEETESTEFTLTTGSSEVTSSEEYEYTSTEVSEETTVESEDETTPSPAEVAITKEQKVKKCRRKKKKPKPEPVKCEDTKFGCCPDGKTIAEGPFSKGCPQPTTCEETEFGCCSDGVSPAKGRNEEGCPPSLCAETLFGCCPDGVGIAEGNDNEGCDEVMFMACKDTQFGCCPDGVTAASGANNTGCFECEGSGECDTCNATQYGCCPDGVRAATGPEYEGCEEPEGSGEPPPEEVDCSVSEYGCCPDGRTVATGPQFEGCGVINAENCTLSYFGCCPDGVSPALGPRYEGCRMPCEDEQFGCCSDGIIPAHGPNQEGCCLNTEYGCCPDNILPAHGPNLEGCGCQYSTYGCCPDNATAARGPEAEGCGCQYTKHGCCPNRYTPAAGPDFQGCPCYTYQFGCCPDGMTVARGPYNQGCGCENTEFGCCSDDRTPASGPNKEGCGCESSKFGCCPDGEIEAQGEKFEGCKEVPITAGEACSQEKDRGSCRDFKVKWFFDTEYGGCSRFWYGGCEGNDNRFESQEECKDKCVEPPGRDACLLPKIEGPCEGYYPQWYYDSERKQCGQFIYGGCLGNNNRFETREECQDLCVIPDTLDACEQPKLEGPCKGNFSLWYYDQELRMCQEFTYGGCHGNRNNFLTETACHHQCLQRSRDYCALPRDEGNCTDQLPRWYFDVTENRCMPFYYSGCEGNANKFETEKACAADCPSKVEKDLCLLPAAAGECHNYTERWYYDSYHVRCTPFYYGGCGGNQNNFVTMQDCQQRCESGYITPEPEEEFKTEWCFLPGEHGPCSESVINWYYDSRDGACKQFRYGGCHGNGNRFPTREECEYKCGSVQDACDLPRVVGPCSGSMIQWYYDRGTDTCYEFDYGGCQGNANRFGDRQECEEFCKVSIGSTAGPLGPSELSITTQGPGGVGEISDICSTSVDAGPCQEEHPAWWYDRSSGSCQPFIYGGCGGNANRFESEEQCERHCGAFKGQDVCSLPYEIGPCKGNFRKWYYNPSAGGCQEFGYGGCNGNGNRFSSLEECETICFHREELHPHGNDTTLSHQAICRLPVDSGPCVGDYYKRWYFDEDRQTCIPFIYSGCAGNRNRFKNFQSCLKFCSVVLQEGQPSFPDVGPNVIDVGAGPEKPGEDKCKKQQCHCPYGVERYIDTDGCEKCQCHEPCKNHICPDGTLCAVDLFRNPRTGETEFRAVCRSKNKPGECPRFAVSSISCVQECQSDAECSGDAKCCFSGCISSCVNPVFAEHFTTEAPRLPPQPIYEPGADPLRFEETETEPEVRAEEGNYVTLHCVARGYPPPTITWRKGSVVIDGSGRYKLLLNGSLQIIGLYRKDSGIYYCVAYNDIGQSIQKEFNLEVTEPTSRPAEVIGEDRTYVVVTLAAPAVLQCYAVGWPPPTVTWWRGDRMLPLSSEQFEQRRDYSLLIRSVTLRNLGPYTCQAYNGYGRAASWTVTVQAIRPAGILEDSAYDEFLVSPPRKPETLETAHPTKKPDYPYRPVRPSPPPRPRPQPRPPVVEPTTSPEIPPQPEIPAPPSPETDSEDTPRRFTVPVQANVSLTRTVYPIGSDISIPCDVDGYPIPQVVWYKDEELLEPNERIRITENHRLLIIRANGSDAGTYRCSASNQYGSSSSSITIAVEGVYIHPNCTDNPFFANCRLIVAGQYCTHKYYARFCCKSCTQAGQLPSYGPHLEKTGTSISRRK